MNRKLIAVMSGKGGVGKSSLAVLTATAMSAKYKTILLDFDICGPSISGVLGVDGSLVRSSNGFVPVKAADNLYFISFGLCLKPEDAVIWRGPKKQVILSLFYESSHEFECVVVDTPPGVSEEHEFLTHHPFQVLFVTTPQNVALNDLQNSIEFVQKHSMNIIGIIENMAGMACACCGERFYPFGRKGAELLAQEYSLPYLGSLEIDNSLTKMMDSGIFLENKNYCKSFQEFNKILEKLEL